MACVATPRPSFSQSWRKKRTTMPLTKEQVCSVRLKWPKSPQIELETLQGRSKRLRRQCFDDLAALFSTLQHSAALCSTLLSTWAFPLLCLFSKHPRRHDTNRTTIPPMYLTCTNDTFKLPAVSLAAKCGEKSFPDR